MDSTTYLKNLKISPKKLRFYLHTVKKHTPAAVLERLYYERTAAGKILYKAVQSAVSNAKSVLKTNEDMLTFKLFTVEEGLKIKRYRPGGRGTPKPIMKRRSHIKIVLAARDGAKTPNIEKSAVAKKEEAKPALKAGAEKSEARNTKSETKAKK